MTFAPFDRFGPYQIISLLGEGGMGAVYRARDTKLNRDVAVKVLLPEVASDPDRLARFRREAQVLAALNHPNIAHIHGLEESQAGPAGVAPSIALVMEFVDGEGLDRRIAQGPLSLDEALPIATQIADALEAAHEQGIIHRDLKPANIKVTPAGVVKILDFGLAKAIEAPGRDAAPLLTQSPTITSPAMTVAGMILGTAAYMAPEQAKGRAVDRRADIWAYGCVLYEMLTGHRAFKGDDVTDTITSVMRDTPDWNALPAETPVAAQRLIRRCLEKDVRRRLPHIGIARLELSEPEVPSAPPTSAPAASSRLRSVLPWAVAAILAVAAGGLALRRAPVAAAPSLGPVRFEIATPSGTRRLGHRDGIRGSGPAASHYAVSPDGREIVFSAVSDDGVHLWLRSLATSEPRMLPGTEDASFPFWSPDGRAVAFFANGMLKRLTLDGTKPVTLAPAERGEGGSWGPDNTVLFAPTVNGPVFRVPASGGTPVAVTTLASGTISHTWPSHLPDGRRFVYLATEASGRRAVRLRALEQGTDVEVLETVTRAMMAGEFLVFQRDGQLVAQRLDATSGRLTGEPSILSADVALNAGNARVGFFASGSGVLLVRSNVSTQFSRLTWRARDGRVLGTIGAQGDFGHVQISPDGSRALVQIDAGPIGARTSDLWIYDPANGNRQRLTADDNTFKGAPIWSRDGQRVVYWTARNFSSPSGRQLMIQGAGGAEAPRRAGDSDVGGLSSWAPDERGIVVTDFTATGLGADAMRRRGFSIAPLDGGKPTPLLATDTGGGWAILTRWPLVCLF